MRRTIIFLTALCAVVMTWSCKEATPEERVANARARYTVKLNGFFAKTPDPLAAVVPEDEEGAEPEGETEAEGEGDAGDEGTMDETEEMAAPEGVDILVDLIVQHDMDEALPGITVDLTMVDPDRNEKGAWKIWIETAGLPKANQKQVTHTLEDTDYVEGDAFTVEIASGIPEDLGAYREFSEAAP